jgi:hypothetical protein
MTITKILILPVLLASASTAAGCYHIVVHSVLATGSVVQASRYTAEDALVAEERPEAIADRMVTGIKARGELRGVNRERDAIALGQIYYRGNAWGYSVDDRKAALDALIDAAETVNADLQPTGETETLTEPARDIVRITLAAMERSLATDLNRYAEERLALIAPGAVRDAFEQETPDQMAFPYSPFFGGRFEIIL